MSVLNSYVQAPQESKIYTISYTKWLDTSQGEQLNGVTVSVDNATTPPLDVVATFNATDNTVSIQVSGGLSGEQYSVTINATTTLTQTKSDCIIYTIQDSCG